MNNFSFKFFLSILICNLLYACSADNIEGETLILGGTIIDGTGDQAKKSDILIHENKIVWIGDSEQMSIIADTSINAKDKIITPGFIDIHAHGDPLKTPDFTNFLAMGVTSIALGMDGSSKKSHEITEWINETKNKGSGVNILPFIGHGTLRTESGIGISKEVSKPQLQVMTSLLDSALSQGCWGLSMGLEYMPGYHADGTELTALAKVVGKYDALITSHIRNEDDDKIENALNEMIALAEYCNVNISHLKVVYGKGTNRAKEIIDKLDDTVNAKYKVTADLYPYTASFTGIGIVFPDWAKVPTKYAQIKKERGEELLEFLHNKINQRNGPEATLFGTGPYAGKTLQDLVEEYKLPYAIILRDIIGPYGASAAYFVMNDDLQNELLKSSLVMVASDGSPTMRHPRGYGTFAKVLEEFVVRDSILKIEEAVHKMTGQPAKTLGLEDRGIIKVGSMAELLIFDPKAIRNNASFEQPHELASGMDIILLNGKLVWQEGKHLRNNGTVILRDTDM